MKRLICLLIIIVLVISGCGFTVSSGSKLSTDEQYANVFLDDIINAVKNKDKEGIKSLFAPKVEKQIGEEAFDSEVEEFIAFFEGDIISYEKAEHVSSEKSIRDGKLSYLSIGNAGCIEIETTVETYIISFACICVDENNKNKEGLWWIWFGVDEMNGERIGSIDY